MGEHVRGTTIDLGLIIENKNTLARIDVSEVSCYIEQDDEILSTLTVSHVSTGYYRSHWQTTSSTPLGKYDYKFVYTKTGKRMKKGVTKVV